MTWLSVIEAWEKENNDEDINLMARVIRELAGYIALETVPMEPLVRVGQYKKLSDDAQEVIDELAERD